MVKTVMAGDVVKPKNDVETSVGKKYFLGRVCSPLARQRHMLALNVVVRFRCGLKESPNPFLDSGQSLQPHPVRDPSSILMERSNVEGRLLLLLPNCIGWSFDL